MQISPGLIWFVRAFLMGLSVICCTSWNINHGWWVVYWCLLGSIQVCIKNFAGGSRRWLVVKNVIPILFKQFLHDRFITPCLWLKGDLHFLIQFFSLRDLYPLPRKIRIGLQKLLIGCAMAFFKVSLATSCPNLINTSAKTKPTQFLLSSMTKGNGVWFMLPKSLRVKAPLSSF